MADFTVFEQLVKDKNIPDNSADLTAKFKEIAVEEGVVFNNESAYSPFWRLVLALVVTPVLWLLGLLTNDVLPNLFLKTAKGQWLELYAFSVGVERKAATKAQGKITLKRLNTTDELLVPAGTVIQSAPINGTIYRMITLADQSFLAGNDELLLLTEAEVAGTAYNLADGFYALLESPLSGIVSIKNEADWLTLPGADIETDDNLRERSRNQFSAVNKWHVDAAYISMISSFPGIGANDIYIEHNAPRGPGTANAYILFDADAPTAQYLTDITDFITTQGNHGLGDDVEVLVMPTTAVDIDLAVVPIANLSTTQKATLKTNIENFIRTAFRELSLDNYQPTVVIPNARFVWSRLMLELHNEFNQVLSLDFTDDTDIVSTFSVPSINNLSVTGLD